MKKLFTFMMASAAAVAAYAVPSAATAGLFSANPVKTKIVKDVPAFPVIEDLTPVNISIDALRKADAQPREIPGWWTLILGDYYSDTAEGDFINCFFEATMDGETVTFTPGEGGNNTGVNLYSFWGTYNEANQTISFKKEYFGVKTVLLGGIPEEVFVYIVPYIYNTVNNQYSYPDEIITTYNDELDAWEFGVNQGLAWAAYVNQDDVEPIGNLAQYDITMGFQFDASASIAGDWIDIGEATFMDGWLVPAMGLNQQTNKYKVPMQQSASNKYVYRLEDPYHYGPVAKYNGDKQGGYIVFDMSDRDHILFLPASAGFLNEAIIPGGISTLYCYNQLGRMAVTYPDYTLDEIIKGIEGLMPFTTYSSGVVSLNSIRSNNSMVYDANLGNQSNPYGGNAWDATRMTASIEFPEGYNAAVGAIEADCESPVEYYNLQGVRVFNPQPGQLVIKKSGATSVKEIIR